MPGTETAPGDQRPSPGKERTSLALIASVTSAGRRGEEEHPPTPRLRLPCEISEDLFMRTKLCFLEQIPDVLTVRPLLHR